MKVENICYPAVRAFNRTYGPIAERRNMAERADAGFDGGEWSRVSHSNMAFDEFNETLARVAPRFGMTLDELESHVIAAGHLEVERFMNHKLKGEGK